MSDIKLDDQKLFSPLCFLKGGRNQYLF